MSTSNNTLRAIATNPAAEPVLRQRKKINIYGCGGCGGNLLARIAADYQSADGQADFEPYWLDTSASDVAGHGDLVKRENLFLLPQADGAAKIRGSLAAEIKRAMPGVIERFRPADVNIILSSASGGSGAVLATYAAAEIIKTYGASVIMINVGTLQSTDEIKNTTQHLTDLDALAERLDTPISLIYTENEVGKGFGDADEFVRAQVNALRVLFSGQNTGLDSADVARWLNHPNHHQPQLQMVSVGGPELKQVVARPLTVTTITTEDQPTGYDGTVGAAYHGYVDESLARALGFYGDRLHFITSASGVEELHERLKEALREANRQLGSNIRRARLSNDGNDGDSLSF